MLDMMPATDAMALFDDYANRLNLAAGPEDHQRTIHLRNEIAQVGGLDFGCFGVSGRAASSAASSRMISGGAVIMD